MTIEGKILGHGEDFTDESVIDDLNFVIQKDLLRQVEVFRVPAVVIRWSLDSDRWEIDRLFQDEDSIGERFVLSELHMIVFTSAEQVNRIIRSGELLPPPATQVSPLPPPPITRRVTLPAEIQRALFSLQRRPDGIEYGGAIDFEVTGDKPEIERIVAFLGEKRAVKAELFRKWAPDFEVHFHTHPNRKTAQPSVADVLFLLASPQQAEIIIALEDLAIYQKTPGVADKLSVDELCKLAADRGVANLLGVQQNFEPGRDSVESFLSRSLGITTQRIKRTSRSAVPLNIEVVRQQMAREAIQR